MTRPPITTLSRNIAILLATLASTLILVGCNRALPTEPEDNLSTLPAQQTQQHSASSEAAVSGSTRLRPTRAGAPLAAPAAAPAAPPTTPPPTPPPPAMISDCNGLCDNILHIPSEGDVMAAVLAARDRVRSAVASGEIKANRSVRDWNATPGIEWKACYFMVDNGFYYDANGNRVVGACAAGMTDYAHKKLVITTKEQSRTLPLVKWEATNYYLYAIGRTDLLDRWQ